jgi:DNA-binding PadR family transcriptional regulator
VRSNISPEPALLGFLSDGPMHGYDLYKQVHSRLDLVWHVGMSQTYAIAKNYVTRGWIRTRVQSQGMRPSKKVLELTPAGQKAFEDWLHQPAHGLREFRVDFFLRLYFARLLGAASVQGLVDDQIAATRHELENLNERRIAAVEESDLFQLTRDFRIQQLTTILKWLETNRGKLVRLKSTTLDSRKRSVRRAGARRGK